MYGGKKQNDGTVNILLRHRSASLFEAALALVLQICRGIRSNPGEVLLDAWFLSDSFHVDAQRARDDDGVGQFLLGMGCRFESALQELLKSWVLRPHKNTSNKSHWV